MLIICPDCGAEVSQYAETCIKCGFPIEKFIAQHCITDMKKTFICPKCGGHDSYYDFAPNDPRHIACEFCGTAYIQTNLTSKEYTALDLQEFRKGNKDFEADMAKKYGHGEFDEDAYHSRKEVIAQRVRERESKKETQQNTPKCPTCGSTNLKKITATQKASNAVLFGLFGNKRKKQFHCNNCGYEW